MQRHNHNGAHPCGLHMWTGRPWGTCGLDDPRPSNLRRTRYIIRCNMIWSTPVVCVQVTLLAEPWIARCRIIRTYVRTQVIYIPSLTGLSFHLVCNHTHFPSITRHPPRPARQHLTNRPLNKFAPTPTRVAGPHVPWGCPHVGMVWF